MHGSRILKALLAGAAVAAAPLALSAQEARTQPCDALYQNAEHSKQTDKALFIWNFSRKDYKVTLDKDYPPNGAVSSFSVDPKTLEEKDMQDFKGGESITIPSRRVLILKLKPPKNMIGLSKGDFYCRFILEDANKQSLTFELLRRAKGDLTPRFCLLDADKQLETYRALKARKGTGEDKDYYVGELEVLSDALK